MHSKFKLFISAILCFTIALAASCSGKEKIKSAVTAFADTVYVEQQNCLGRADLVVEIQNRRIVFELKYVTSEKDAQIKLQEAVNQIQERDYGNTYPNMDLLRIALVFNGDSKVRAFTHYQEVL